MEQVKITGKDKEDEADNHKLKIKNKNETHQKHTFQSKTGKKQRTLLITLNKKTETEEYRREKALRQNIGRQNREALRHGMG